jgi:hypothetical protein
VAVSIMESTNAAMSFEESSALNRTSHNVIASSARLIPSFAVFKLLRIAERYDLACPTTAFTTPVMSGCAELGSCGQMRSSLEGLERETPFLSS